MFNLGGNYTNFTNSLCRKPSDKRVKNPNKYCHATTFWQLHPTRGRGFFWLHGTVDRPYGGQAWKRPKESSYLSYRVVFERLVNNLPTTFIHYILRQPSDAFRTLKGASSARMLIIYTHLTKEVGKLFTKHPKEVYTFYVVLYMYVRMHACMYVRAYVVVLWRLATSFETQSPTKSALPASIL
jgi:hypothetical protein